MKAHKGDVMVLFGDVPLIRAATLSRLIERRRRADRPALAVIGMRPHDPGPYGRLVLGADGMLERIVEAKDADEQERRIGLCNSGVMIADGDLFWNWIERLGSNNAQGEFYLTDVVGLARADNRLAAAIEAPADEMAGVNSRAELAAAESRYQARRRDAAMADGATLIDPASIHFSFDTRLGRDVVIGPSVVFGPGVNVGDEVIIRPFCHVEGATIGKGAIIGPFARLRPGSVIGEGAHVGNFVEIKKSELGAHAKANHLSYLGDAKIGARANIGAGTITCNYDGFEKMETVIGADAFIGSDTALVAPVSVGEGAIVAAGSVITSDVAPDALAIARSRQVEKPGWAGKFRARKKGAAGRRKERPCAGSSASWAGAT
jgi:bifunctional UDP-N-acetylglucosamine pyrophosphorylase/glucosamine-1-phosphate N-acetyltransferase